MAKLIRIDEFGVYLVSSNLFSGCDDWDETIGLKRTDDEYIIPSDSKFEGV